MNNLKAVMKMRQRTNAVRTNGFRSKFEQDVATSLERQGVKYDYEGRELPFTRECTYTPDFRLPNGIFIEVKGYFLPSDRTKLLLVRKQNPHVDIRLVFMNSRNRLSKRSKTTYAKWADKHGFLWAEKQVPERWINE